jgi:hypothetical protein
LPAIEIIRHHLSTIHIEADEHLGHGADIQ